MPEPDYEKLIAEIQETARKYADRVPILMRAAEDRGKAEALRQVLPPIDDLGVMFRLYETDNTRGTQDGLRLITLKVRQVREGMEPFRLASDFPGFPSDPDPDQDKP